MWGWLLGRLPSKAVMWAAIAAMAGGAVAWLRRDAHKDAEQDMKEGDRDNAEEIRERVADGDRDRADGVREYSDRGFRD